MASVGAPASIAPENSPPAPAPPADSARTRRPRHDRPGRRRWRDCQYWRRHPGRAHLLSARSNEQSSARRSRKSPAVRRSRVGSRSSGGSTAISNVLPNERNLSQLLAMVLLLGRLPSSYCDGQTEHPCAPISAHGCGISQKDWVAGSMCCGCALHAASDDQTVETASRSSA